VCTTLRCLGARLRCIPRPVLCTATRPYIRLDTQRLSEHVARCVSRQRVPFSAVVDTGAGLTVVSEDFLPPGWGAYVERALTRTRIVDASGQAVKAPARLPLTLCIHNKPMRFPFIVFKCLSVPLILGCDFQCAHTNTILPHDDSIERTTGAVSHTLSHRIGSRCWESEALHKPGVHPKELTLVGLTVLQPGAQTQVKVVTRSIGSSLVKGRAEYLIKRGLNLAHGYHHKVRRH